MTLDHSFFAVSAKIDCELIVAIRDATMTPLTPFQRTTLTTFIYSAAKRLSSELVSDTKPASDQDLLILGPAASL